MPCRISFIEAPTALADLRPSCCDMEPSAAAPAKGQHAKDEAGQDNDQASRVRSRPGFGRGRGAYALKRKRRLFRFNRNETAMKGNPHCPANHGPGAKIGKRIV